MGVDVYVAPKPDIDAPIVDFTASIPPVSIVDGAVAAVGISTQQAIVLKFNEAVQTGPYSSCRGQISFCPSGSPTCSAAFTARAQTSPQTRTRFSFRRTRSTSP